MQHHKIIAICQIYNELEKGNLERFFSYLRAGKEVDEIVIYDDASTDGSYEYALSKTEHVIRGKGNNFANERNHKELLLQKAIALGAEFILWIDADEVLDVQAAEHLQSLCQECIDNDIDGINFRELNLWRSATWRRIDSYYDDGNFTRLWKVKPGLSFGKSSEGLHQPLFPPQILKTKTAPDMGFLHYGFADVKNIAYKYYTYRSHGQRGYVMLDRLIDESSLKLEQIEEHRFPKGLWKKEEAPRPLQLAEAVTGIRAYRDQVRRPKYSIICVVDHGIKEVEFIYDQVVKNTDLGDKEFFFVTNNTEPGFLEYLGNHYIPHFDFRSSSGQGVHGAFNHGAQMARGDFLIFITPNLAFTPGWIEILAGAYNGSNCVVSRVIEKNGGKKNDEHLEDKVEDGGSFKPLLIKKSHFESVGGYPASGDKGLFQQLVAKGIIHQTALGSVAYHSGEQEKKDIDAPAGDPFPVAIVNDLVTGTIGEKVLWDYLIEGLPGAYGIDQRLVGKKKFEERAAAYIAEHKPKTRVIIQNATFIGTIDPNRYTIAFLQDDMRKMKRDSVVQEANVEAASLVVTNSEQTATSYMEYDPEIISVGVDAELFSPQAKKAAREAHGFADVKGPIAIFVGSFSEVKGWSKIQQLIKDRHDITWILVTKYDEHVEAPNVRLFSRIGQEKLAGLLNCADFFILGSPVETQCLAAIEAALCDVPVLMPLTGIFEDFSPEERKEIGIFTSDLADGVKKILASSFSSPRKAILNKDLTTDYAISQWRALLERIFLNMRQAELTKKGLSQKQKPYRKYAPGLIVRKKLMKPLIGREYIFPSTMSYSLVRMTYKSIVALGLEPLVKKIRNPKR